MLLKGNQSIMSEEIGKNELGRLLTKLIHNHSLSMRRLSELTNIDTATISRIVNGKRKANLNHLERFSESLDVPIATLLQAAGYEVEEQVNQSNVEIQASVEMIQNYMKASNEHNHSFSISKVKDKLTKYEQYAQTDKGNTMIKSKFREKIAQVGSGGPFIVQLKQLFHNYTLQKTSPFELAIIGSALLYFIIPIDVIPDYLFPIGYLDDAIAVNLVANNVLNKASL